MQTIDVTPDYKAIFARMLAEAAIFGKGNKLFKTYDSKWRAESLREVQRFIAPLNVALNAITSAEELERLREVTGQIVDSIDRAAQQAEEQADLK